VTRRDLVARVARVPRTTVEGTFYRHAHVGTRDLRGSNAGGRWGPPGGFEVLYLGRPEPSVVIEAHRHLVEAVEGMRPDLVGPRALIAVAVAVGNVADLRDAAARVQLGLPDEVIFSAARDPDAYQECRLVARAAHQLELHGIIAPAAGRFGGETLALFPAHLPVAEQPRIIDVAIWSTLPADPRQLRALQRTEADEG